jgi:hypothetical protein
MKSKLITLAIGAAILGTGSVAMAHDRDDHRDEYWRRHEWREHEWREHEWREHHRPYWHRDWYPYERHYAPPPDWRYRSSYPYVYEPDGVSIILRGHIN